MEKLINKKFNTSILHVSAFHLPQEEYQKLDMFMEFPNVYPIHTAIYSSGVIVVLISEDVSYFRGFLPVLYEILVKCVEEGVKIIDFSENEPTTTFVQTYKHT